jgi:hypothetical protein
MVPQIIRSYRKIPIVNEFLHDLPLLAIALWPKAQKKSAIAGPCGSLSEARIVLGHSIEGSLALKSITAQPEARPLLLRLLSLPSTALMIKAYGAFDMQWNLL